MCAKDFKIAIVYNLEQEITQGDPQDLIALEDTASTAQYLYDAMLALGYNVDKIAAHDSLDEFKRMYAHLSNLPELAQKVKDLMRQMGSKRDEER